MKYCLRLILLFLLISSVSYAQDMIEVTGLVTDSELNEPIIGASVVVKGNPSIGAITDIDGNFKLKIPADTKVLEITYIGMEAMDVAVKPHMVIKMGADAKLLKEVVVTGMQSVDKRLFTGASTKIDATKAKLDGVADISRSLEGRAAGVSVQNVSGTFGTAPKIRVRGATSIYGNSRPLWVVDGVVLEDNVNISSDDLSSGNAETLISSAIAGINADDIESFEVLKDGSATSIYGARAMAGVIVVTTKRGQAGQSRFSYTGEFTTRLKPNYRDFNISNSQEQMGIYKELEEKGWLQYPVVHNSSASGVYGKMYDLVSTLLGYDANGNPIFGIDNERNAMNQYLREAEYRNTDWFDELFTSSVMHNHALSVSVGTERAQSYVSLSVMQDPGWTLSSKVERYTINANTVFKISPTLELKLNGMGSRRDQLAPGTLSQGIDPVSGAVTRHFDINPYSYALNTSRTADPDTYYKQNYAPFNIFNELDNNYIDLAVTDVKVQGDLTWKIKKSWSANVLAAMRYNENRTEHHIKEQSNMAMAYRAGVVGSEVGLNNMIRSSNPYLYTDPLNPNAEPETVLGEGGIYDYKSNNMKDFSFRASTSYKEQFNDVHLVDLFGAAELQSTERQYKWFRGWGYMYDNGGEPFYDYRVFKMGSEENTPYYSNTWTTNRNIAFIGNATYSYMAKYVLNGTLRYEGSNRMGKSRQSRWLPTWNVAGAWNMHEETWFKNPVLSSATLKASYSLTADAGPVNVSNALPIYKPVVVWKPMPDEREAGLEFQSPQNDELTYEKKHEFNVRAELGFLDDRINVTADFYVRNQFDLLGQRYTSGLEGGGIFKWANLADMKTGGFELAISSVNMKKRDFRWTTDFIFSNSYTEITDLESEGQLRNLVMGSGFPLVGYPVRALFSIPFVGLNEEGLPIFINENGDYTITNINFQESDQEKLKANLKYEGPTDPPINGSLGNTFDYKNFSLNVFLTYSFGSVVRLDPVFAAAYSDLSSLPREFKNRWVVPGDEAYTTIPTIASRRLYSNYSNLSYAYNAYNYSTERIAKGDFIRLKDVSLSYTVPSAFCEKMKIGSASLKLQATNLFLLYADKKLNGQDPEFFNSGGVAVPMPKQFTLTLRLGF